MVGVPEVKASRHSALISATVQAFDAADFVGVCRQNSTGDWSVDGLLLRHYAVGIPEVKVSQHSASISAAVQAFDAADFVGVCRQDSTGDWSVDGLLLRHYVA